MQCGSFRSVHAAPSRAERRAGPRVGDQPAARREFLKLRPVAPFVALATSAEIQAAASPESVTRFRIRLNEQGVEWTTIESEGISHDRLVPE